MFIFIVLIGVILFTSVIGTPLSIITGKKIIDISKSLIIGMSVIIIAGRYCYRASLPIEIGKYIMIVTFILSLLYIIIKKYKYNYTDLFGTISAVPLFVILLFPLWYEKLFIFHYGPDLVGNLVSSSYLINNGSFSDLVGKYTEMLGHSEWWISGRQDPWRISNRPANKLFQLNHYVIRK
jgi:hypothetical protein